MGNAGQILSDCWQSIFTLKIVAPVITLLVMFLAKPKHVKDHNGNPKFSVLWALMVTGGFVGIFMAGYDSFSDIRKTRRATESHNELYQMLVTCVNQERENVNLFSKEPIVIPTNITAESLQSFGEITRREFEQARIRVRAADEIVQQTPSTSVQEEIQQLKGDLAKGVSDLSDDIRVLGEKMKKTPQADDKAAILRSLHERLHPSIEALRLLDGFSRSPASPNLESIHNDLIALAPISELNSPVAVVANAGAPPANGTPTTTGGSGPVKGGTTPGPSVPVLEKMAGKSSVLQPPLNPQISP